MIHIRIRHILDDYFIETSVNNRDWKLAATVFSIPGEKPSQRYNRALRETHLIARGCNIAGSTVNVTVGWEREISSDDLFREAHRYRGQ